MPELDEAGRPLDAAGIKAWWKTWGLDHEATRLRRQATYARQKAEAEEMMRHAKHHPAPQPGGANTA
jgi:hypothetical protein